MKIPCPYCNSTNTRQHSAIELVEEHQMVETSWRCNRCKKYFYRRFKISEPQYAFHPLMHWESDPTRQWGSNRVLNPNRDNPPDENTGRY